MKTHKEISIKLQNGLYILLIFRIFIQAKYTLLHFESRVVVKLHQLDIIPTLQLSMPNYPDGL